MNRVRPPLVTFDLGGVIVRLSRSLDEAASVSGIALRAAPRAEDRKLASLFDQWQRGIIADQSFFEEWAACSGRFDASDAPRLSLGWLAGEHAGISGVLQELADAGVTMGCLSNTCAHHWEHMTTRADLFPSMQLLTHRHGSHQIGEMKPAPAIYRRYEQLTGRGPDEIVFFDDLEENVRGAQACGWTAVRIARDREPADQIREALASLGVL